MWVRHVEWRKERREETERWNKDRKEKRKIERKKVTKELMVSRVVHLRVG
jgi:hypothetical protein